MDGFFVAKVCILCLINEIGISKARLLDYKFLGKIKLQIYLVGLKLIKLSLLLACGLSSVLLIGVQYK